MSNSTIIVSGIMNNVLRRAVICAILPIEVLNAISVNTFYFICILGVALYRGLGLKKIIDDARRVW